MNWKEEIPERFALTGEQEAFKKGWKEALTLAEKRHKDFEGLLKVSLKAKTEEITRLKKEHVANISHVKLTELRKRLKEERILHQRIRKSLEELKEWNCYCKTCGKHGPAATKSCFNKNHLILIPWNDIEEHFAEWLNKNTVIKSILVHRAHKPGEPCDLERKEPRKA